MNDIHHILLFQFLVNPFCTLPRIVNLFIWTFKLHNYIEVQTELDMCTQYMHKFMCNKCCGFGILVVEQQDNIYAMPPSAPISVGWQQQRRQQCKWNITSDTPPLTMERKREIRISCWGVSFVLFFIFYNVEVRKQRLKRFALITINKQLGHIRSKNIQHLSRWRHEFTSLHCKSPSQCHTGRWTGVSSM